MKFVRLNHHSNTLVSRTHDGRRVANLNRRYLYRWPIINKIDVEAVCVV